MIIKHLKGFCSRVIRPLTHQASGPSGNARMCISPNANHLDRTLIVSEAHIFEASSCSHMQAPRR